MERKMVIQTEDTIVAIATPPGIGGIAVIRVSGPDAAAIVQQNFDSPFQCPEERKAIHGWIRDGGEPVDEVLITYFKKPNSYTGEDVVEISCHGGSFISRRIAGLIIQGGARPARPGEFTERAFLNGKIDLSQAEAVADLIHAKTEASRRAAVYQLEGRLSERIQTIRESLLRLCGLLEIELDFGDEDVEFASRAELKQQIASAITDCDTLLTSYERGRVCREGVRLAITGRPNVGKSSILNALLEKERAIVTEFPGTTRDIIEEALDIEGIFFSISDGAGVRKTEDPVEREGVRRAEARIEEADIVLLVLDGGQPFSPEDGGLVEKILSAKKKMLVAVNKADLPQQILPDELKPSFPGLDFWPVSAKTGTGISALIRGFKDMALGGTIPREGEVLLTQSRHQQAIQSARRHLVEADGAVNSGLSQEFVALDMRGALNALGDIIGETTTDDILSRIFSEFCIGK